MRRVHRESVLFLTIDSCRYDTFANSKAPNLRWIGPLHRVQAPGNFTYSSHAAMFVGFTPGLATVRAPFVNPKFGKIFRIENGGFAGTAPARWRLRGRSIIDGFKRIGYRTVGTGAVAWFNPATETGTRLVEDFHDFYFPGDTFALPRQLTWLADHISQVKEPVFAFLNIGETHAPYFFEGAPWDRTYNPCVPFSSSNDARECRARQRACLEYVDVLLEPLLSAFGDASIIACADHGDAWGEDGLWEHGIHHEKVYEVPLLFRIRE